MTKYLVINFGGPNEAKVEVMPQALAASAYERSHQAPKRMKLVGDKFDSFSTGNATEIDNDVVYASLPFAKSLESKDVVDRKFKIPNLTHITNEDQYKAF